MLLDWIKDSVNALNLNFLPMNLLSYYLLVHVHMQYAQLINYFYIFSEVIWNCLILI